MAEVFVCQADELADGEVRIVSDSGVEIGVIRHAGRFYAYENLCPHQGGPACEGMRLPKVRDVIDEKHLFVGQTFDEGEMHIVCPWHGYEYDLETGAHVSDSKLRITKFNVLIRDGGVYVRL